MPNECFYPIYCACFILFCLILVYINICIEKERIFISFEMRFYVWLLIEILHYIAFFIGCLYGIAYLIWIRGM